MLILATQIHPLGTETAFENRLKMKNTAFGHSVRAEQPASQRAAGGTRAMCFVCDFPISITGALARAEELVGSPRPS